MSKKEGIQIILSGVNENVKKTLEHAQLENIIGKENICGHINEALERSKEIK